MTGAELARAVANVTWEVLQTLTTALKPWAMEDLSSRVGVPPIDLGADWTAAVEQARVDLAPRRAGPGVVPGGLAGPSQRGGAGGAPGAPTAG